VPGEGASNEWLEKVNDKEYYESTRKVSE